MSGVSNAYEITAAPMGLDEKNVKIKLSSHTLTIEVEKSEEKEHKHKGLLSIRAPLRVIPASNFPKGATPTKSTPSPKAC
ncbi:Hsp20 family protein [Mesorhizobium sp. J428]|uniref:Hsp20 family protein n=1 Tax=Mesorhizobium sp. J428 TaxID=2898440 RepID=UPI0027E262C3|nr:Hsp20 family protein [Mesorhizobium sp. J428]